MALHAFKDSWDGRRQEIQDSIKNKLDKGIALNDQEILDYELQEDDLEVADALNQYLVEGKNVPGFALNDFLGSPSAKVLIPKIIIGTMRQAADPIYLASKFYKAITLKNGQAIMYPSIGVMRAYDVAEGQEIPQETLDWNVSKSKLISVGKTGVRIQYSDELQKDLEFGLIGLMLQEAGRAMARLKEQKAFQEWKKHSWIVFDNRLRSKDPLAGTTGMDYYGNLNDTMSIDDLLDVIIAVYNNEYNPTDLIMHPLVWTSFAKNGLNGSLTAPFDRETKRESPNAQFKLGPESIQGRMPFGFNVNLSPFAPIDKVNKTYDMFCVDANNVGSLLVKETLKTEEFRDPARDLNNVKVTERYGFATHNEGRAVCSARNISMAKSFAQPERMIVLDK